MIKVYTTSWCPYCNNAKRLLSEKGMKYEEINIEEEGISREGLVELTGGRSVPQIVINDKPIGGYDNLVKLDQAGELSA
ncbi:MAG: glutaredoxin 3 [Candidatus Marinimicrobia bacterium]|nr:glutaredoxin 3 [Candidatus Neomarinimicrobiota bacterium]